MRKATTQKGISKARPAKTRRAGKPKRRAEAVRPDGENQNATVVTYAHDPRETGAPRRLTVTNGRYTVPPLTAFKPRITDQHGNTALDELIAIAILSDKDVKAGNPVDFVFDLTLVARPVLRG